ncbi:MAG: hypothetical protein JW932_06140 [Deltaproteobacteria bacterium]|nr:hypothetical protein [Deltaproteobacteria bacterium]
MYLSLSIIFLLLLGIIVTGVQNSLTLDIKFLTWDLRITLLALIFYAGVTGAAIISLLTLPKLVSKTIKVRKMYKEMDELRRKNSDMKMHAGN